MLVLDNENKPLILDSIYTPTLAEYIWVLDLEMMDYTLAPLNVLEEIYAPTMEIMILGFKFLVPTNWNILVVDDETFQLDTIEIAEVAGKEFRALLNGSSVPTYETAVIRATNFFPDHHNVGPSLPKHQMLCHPVSPEYWVSIAPSDGYNKYLKDTVAGDLM